MEISIAINPSSTKLSCQSFNNSILKFPCINIYKNKYKYIIYKNSIDFMYVDNNAEYYKIFVYDCLSTYFITKDIKEKSRHYIFIDKLYNVCLYTYIIYNKYYNNYCKCKDYHYCFDETINEKKLFNCRDFYKIHSFIYI